MKYLKRGVHLPEKKERSLLTTNIVRSSTPRFIAISLLEKGNISAVSCVFEGDRVLVGTKIADGVDFKAVPIHSSVSGFISKVMPEQIQIESDERDSLDPVIQPQLFVSENPDELIEIVRQAGLVDMGSCSIPLHMKLEEAKMAHIHTLVINGCESEPYLTADHVLMLNHGLEILKGTESLRIACGARQAVIAIERNKLEAVEILKTKNYSLRLNQIEICSFPVKYPQGTERALCETLLERPFRKGESALKAGILVLNVATAFAAYEAIYVGKPLIERVVTVTGECIAEAKNIWARIGTPLSYLIHQCRGLLRDSVRLVLGGPMTGEAINSLDFPVTKNTTGIVALPVESNDVEKEAPCIRCGLCVDRCVASLQPEILVKAIRKENFNLAKEYKLEECIECGVCAYICPSKIPLLEMIQNGKRAFLKKTEPAPIPEYHDVELATHS
ncbi:MAG: hypothetical protein A3G33_09375 [Omnitrophica bacterium RIFCSPLOWO2_12_FULL_44_17]|uniref:Ion-translocating oxidoreductase complex subunit C n=1 Tax=Candidatus Danuiimicrobium aquiferis TaxID=1801832 RepID=A0A1G1KX12_9BACT|nr:MAG: hypothetical protein A3B72_09985 [Omnitrophica bacterium RIFCSPHIGHO2_02_FULL_45_28]OGW91059.1 MAG: hypothetical protein A3E74_00430 [Omnitrophica bacterium RIFCSPHIGHO2_12_FULL_44_12]OGW97395.1 MAG: hypothetical protein A3G33_09375 [Omnitrophica bacterium RIFCSPLOWO2_12_FULL_44_17]OGX04468.1 MAG: hypothetical protein A3J12_10410 [Omnitrophica bacterium RIFCSPLOWO2_02_FULL_44_11]